MHIFVMFIYCVNLGSITILTIYQAHGSSAYVENAKICLLKTQNISPKTQYSHQSSSLG